MIGADGRGRSPDPASEYEAVAVHVTRDAAIGGGDTIARVPRIRRCFASSLHDARHDALRRRPWRMRARALLDGHLPFVVLDGCASDGDEVRETASLLVSCGYAATVRPGREPGAWTARVSRCDRIADTVDLCALADDVAAWIAAVRWGDDAAGPDLAMRIADVLQTDARRYSDHIDPRGWRDDHLLHELLVTSLARGHDPALAVAFWLRSVSGEAWWWHRAGERPQGPSGRPWPATGPDARPRLRVVEGGLAPPG